MTCTKVDFIESLGMKVIFLGKKVTDFNIGSYGKISKMIFSKTARWMFL